MAKPTASTPRNKTPKASPAAKPSAAPSSPPAAFIQPPTTQPGRPAGSKSQSATVVDVFRGECPACGGSETAWSAKSITNECEGIAPNGKAFCAVRVTRKKCANEDCGQVRMEREYLGKPKPAPAK